MNLHHVRFALKNIAIWIEASGANGRFIGTHLWAVEEGEPPTEVSVRPQWSNANWWRPARFTWQPFPFLAIFQDGWSPPLCGARSASRSPRVHTPRYADHRMCQPCVAVATARGIVPLTYQEATQQSAIPALLQTEERLWIEAGRPSPWPSPSET